METLDDFAWVILQSLLRYDEIGLTLNKVELTPLAVASTDVDQKKKIVSLGKGNLGEIKDRLCYPKFKVSSFFTENLG